MLIVALATILLALGSEGAIKAALALCVLIMSVVYLIAALQVPVNWGEALRGTFVPRLPSGAELRLMGLIGTTVVPHNLFLHAATAKAHYADASELPAARIDTYGSILLGAVITLAIAVLAAATVGIAGAVPSSAAELAGPLTSALGARGGLVVGLGLLSAGLSSAVTAPLAAAYALTGFFGWPSNPRSWPFRSIWLAILAFGGSVLLSGMRPVPLIVMAQAANATFLPLVACFVVWIANDERLLGGYRNRAWHNLLGGVVLVVTIGLSAKTFIALLFVVADAAV